MPHDRKSVDALLATACSRMLNAGYVLNAMREMQRQDNQDEYWRLSVMLAEHLTVGGGALAETHRLLLKEMSNYAPQQGGLPN